MSILIAELLCQRSKSGNLASILLDDKAMTARVYANEGSRDDGVAKLWIAMANGTSLERRHNGRRNCDPETD